jgi:hypothetical protein
MGTQPSRTGSVHAATDYDQAALRGRYGELQEDHRLDQVGIGRSFSHVGDSYGDAMTSLPLSWIGGIIWKIQMRLTPSSRLPDWNGAVGIANLHTGTFEERAMRRARRVPTLLCRLLLGWPFVYASLGWNLSCRDEVSAMKAHFT